MRAYKTEQARRLVRQSTDAGRVADHWRRHALEGSAANDNESLAEVATSAEQQRLLQTLGSCGELTKTPSGSYELSGELATIMPILSKAGFACYSLAEQGGRVTYSVESVASNHEIMQLVVVTTVR